MESKTVERMKEFDYHNNKALGSGAIKQACISVAHFKSYTDGFMQKSSTAFDIGSAAHSAILEKDFSKYLKGPAHNKNTIKWKEYVTAHPDKIVLSIKDYALIKGMFETFFASSVSAKLLRNGRPECSFFTTDPNTGLQMKARTDYYVQGDGDFIIDYKTAQSSSPEKFARAIYDYRYDIQAAHYMNVVAAATRRVVKDYFWVVQEKTAPYQVCIYRATEEMIKRASEQIDKALIRIVQAKETNDWKNPMSEKVIDIDIPKWAINLGV